MAIAYFVSFLFNLAVVLLPIAVLTVTFILGTIKAQGRTFFQFLPYTVALSLGITGVTLLILAGNLQPNGVYAVSPFAEVTQRPAILFLVLASIAAYIAAIRGRVPEKARPIARHISIAFGVSALVQCSAVLFASEWLFAFIHVPFHH